MVASGTFQITQTIPVVRVGFEERVLYSGLAPGWLDLYQVNVELPISHGWLLPVEFCFGSDCQPAGWICKSVSRRGEPRLRAEAIPIGSALAWARGYAAFGCGPRQARPENRAYLIARREPSRHLLS